ncbi:hypothetical protein RRG08_060263 [Elysia crispata]|uniref:Uncharacterized protein n=1 Tax=Elysia crispata TaxID=231223 RepID=A0AAE1B7B8_9GAST|nr:hypothetical protein RRG08_060263 [Elysia crispata]
MSRQHRSLIRRFRFVNNKNKMAKFFAVFTLFILGTTWVGTNGDEYDDILRSTMGSSLQELEALTSLTGLGSPYRRSYTPLPYRSYDKGLNMLGGKSYIREIPDLINLVFGLGGHIVGRAGWIVHDAVTSLFDGLMTSQFKLRSPRGGHAHDDLDLLDDLFSGLDFKIWSVIFFLAHYFHLSSNLNEHVVMTFDTKRSLETKLNCERRIS